MEALRHFVTKTFNRRKQTYIPIWIKIISELKDVLTSIFCSLCVATIRRYLNEKSYMTKPRLQSVAKSMNFPLVFSLSSTFSSSSKLLWGVRVTCDISPDHSIFIISLKRWSYWSKMFAFFNINRNIPILSNFFETIPEVSILNWVALIIAKYYTSSSKFINQYTSFSLDTLLLFSSLVKYF